MSITAIDALSSPEPAPPQGDGGPASARPGPKRSMVRKQTLFVGFLVALTAAALTTAGYLYVSEMVTEQIDARLSAIADDRQTLLLTAVHRVGDRVAQLAGRARLRGLLGSQRREEVGREGDAAELRDILDDARDGARDFRAIRLEGPGGEVLATSGEADDLAAIPADPRDPTTGGPPLSAVPVELNGQRAAVFAAEVVSRAGERLGRIHILVDLRRLAGELSDPRWLGETGEVLIARREGDETHFLFPPRLRPDRTRFPASLTPPMNEAIAGRSGLMRTQDPAGREVLAAYRPLGYADWGVEVKIDAAEAYAPVRRLRRLLTAIGGSILAAGLAASYILARRQARPIQRLAEAAEAVADGRLDTPIVVTSDDEIGVLESSFARMTEQLARSHADLEARIHERTRDLEEVRDLLDAFFRISTSRIDSQTLDRTFDSVLAFCARLGYDLAMISLVDRDARAIRGVRGTGTMGDIVPETVRDLDGPDVLARVVREGRVAIIPDATVDPNCDHEAAAHAGVRGQIILPLSGGEEVLGALQVAVRDALDPAAVDLRPLETLASHAGRTLARFNQIEEVRRLNQSLDRRADELARSESALRGQTEILRAVLDCMGEGVVVADRDARLLLINPAAQALLALDPEPKPGAGPEEWASPLLVYPPGVDARYRDEELPLRKAIDGESIDQGEVMLDHPSLQRGRCMLLNSRPLVDERGVGRGGLVVFHEITARKRSELRLAVEYATSRVLAEADSLVEAAPRILQSIGEPLEWDLGALWRVDAAANQVRCLTLWRAPGAEPTTLDEALRNQSFRSGESLVGRVWADRKALWIADLEAAGADESDCGLCRMLVDEGLRSAFGAPVVLRGECLGVLAFFSRHEYAEDPDLLDMTTSLGAQIGQFQDRCQMHARVVQSEKLASLGMLSASVAHEINNPLAYVASNIAVLDRDVRALIDVLACYEPALPQLASSRPELASEIERLDEDYDLAYIKANIGKILDSTRQGVKRVADIVHNLRGFARADRGADGPVDLHASIDAALEMIRGRLERRRIAVDRHCAEAPPVAASQSQLNQVFLNLLVNAMQAIDAADRVEGKIAIDTTLQGEDVRVEIRDNGCGMAPDVLAQIFDPFFTTKSAGEGTGLGLSISHGIILDHGGRIEVDSSPGEGTCFRVLLPVGRKPAPAEA